MNKNLYILSHYLGKEGYLINKQSLRQRLYSDPDEGILPITNTLDFFNVKNIVATVPKTSLDQLPNLFVAQVKKGNEYNLVLVDKSVADKILIVLNRGESVILTKEQFLSNWTELVIVIEKNEASKSLNNKTLFIRVGLLICSSLLIIYIASITQSLFKIFYIISSLSGLFLSFCIVKERFNFNEIPSKFCSVSKNTDCNSVLNSKESRLFKFIDLSDASVIYFTFIILSFIYESGSIIYFILSLLSLPIIAYSIYSQKYIIKKWCPLCLGIGLVLILQLTIQAFIYKSLTLSYLTLITFACILTLIIFAWYQLKELLIVKQQSDSLIIENMSFRRNHNLFLPYYNSISEINTDEDVLSDISFGSTKAAIKILAITNPLCALCFETHDMLMELLNKYENQIHVKFRFFVPYENQDDPKTQIAERLLDLFLNDKDSFNEAYDNWYSVTSVNKWLSKWGICTDKKINVLIRNQVMWCLKSNINYTPTILINGKQFPSFYHPNDIPNFINKLSILD